MIQNPEDVQFVCMARESFDGIQKESFTSMSLKNWQSNIIYWVLDIKINTKRRKSIDKDYH